ncbi:MAG: hypothetical protein SOY06_10145 [Prevotella sp.]|nr:hypothetical protein [Bacteroidales bacterium]MDY4230186.1 hypothetical protein [Prevotella sp.]
MKMRLTNLLATLLCLLGCAVMSSCQVAQVVKDATTFYQCEVHKSDGSVVSGRIGGMRSSNFYASSDIVSVKTATGREKIKSEDADYLLLWDKDYPDRKNQLLYMPYTWKTKKGKDMEAKVWMYVEADGDNLVVLASGISYAISGRGELIISYTSNVGISYYILRKGASKPEYLFNNSKSKSKARQAWAEALKDCPSLVQKINDKTIDPYNFKDIVNAYNPK